MSPPVLLPSKCNNIDPLSLSEVVVPVLSSSMSILIPYTVSASALRMSALMYIASSLLASRTIGDASPIRIDLSGVISTASALFVVNRIVSSAGNLMWVFVSSLCRI